MRYDNASIRDNLNGVVEGILAHLEAAAPTRPRLRPGHPPRDGEGDG
ncbi:hypothetical protein [Brevundimonas sp.]